MRSRTSNYHHPNRGPPNYSYNNNPNRRNLAIESIVDGQVNVVDIHDELVESFQAGQLNKSLLKIEKFNFKQENITIYCREYN